MDVSPGPGPEPVRESAPCRVSFGAGGRRPYIASISFQVSIMDLLDGGLGRIKGTSSDSGFYPSVY